MTLDLTPNYWLSLAVIAVPIVLLTLLGVLVIRLVGRAAERRLANSALVSNEEAVDASAVVTDSGNPRERHVGKPDGGPRGLHGIPAGAAKGASTDPSGHIGPVGSVTRPDSRATASVTTVPITYRDLPSFVRQRRRTGESFTEFSRRIGL